MKKGASLLYAWEVVGADNMRDFHYDFHGHTLDEGTVATYKQSFGLKQQGALVAPFDGIQGWQFSNSSEDAVVVRIRFAGFYDLVPPGQDGNLAGIIATVPAAQARPNIPPTPATK